MNRQRPLLLGWVVCLVVFLGFSAGAPCPGNPADEELSRHLTGKPWQDLQEKTAVFRLEPDVLKQWRTACEGQARENRQRQNGLKDSPHRRRMKELSAGVADGVQGIRGFSQWTRQTCTMAENQLELSMTLEKMAGDLARLWTENTAALRGILLPTEPGFPAFDQKICCPDAFEASGKREQFLETVQRLNRLFRALQRRVPGQPGGIPDQPVKNTVASGSSVGEK